MTKTRLVLHVGYPKTGTTTLQRSVFPQVSGIDYWGRAPGLPGPEVMEAIFGICLCNDGTFERRVEGFVNTLKARIAEATDDVILLSWEGFLNPQTTRFYGPGDVRRNARRLATVCGRLTDVADTKIVITTRSQGDLIPSFYAQMSDGDRKTGLHDGSYAGFLAQMFDDPYANLADVFDYEKNWRLYTELFGAEAVCLIPMEGLFDRADPAFRRRFAEFTGIDADRLEGAMGTNNASNVRGKKKGGDTEYVKHSVGKARPLYRLTRTLRRIAAGVLGENALHGAPGWTKVLYHAIPKRERTTFVVGDDEKKRLLGLYQASNLALAEAIGIDLRRYGYILEETAPTAADG